MSANRPDHPDRPDDAEDRFAHARAFMGDDRFARELGVEVASLDEEECVCRLTVRDQHRNGANVAHGGVVFTLGDYAAALLAAAQGGPVLGISAQVNYLAAAPGGTLTATARRLRAGKTLVHAQVEVVDDRGRTVAAMMVTGFRTAASFAGKPGPAAPRPAGLAGEATP